jgi:hypothetical protein
MRATAPVAKSARTRGKPRAKAPLKPTKLTPEARETYVAAIGLGATHLAASAAAGVHPSTAERHRNANAAFAADIEKAKRGREVLWLKRIADASSKQWTAAAWLLERTNPDHYGRRAPEAEHSGAVKIIIEGGLPEFPR